jgi:hypothetical protein
MADHRFERIVESVVGPRDRISEAEFGIVVRRLGIPRDCVEELKRSSGPEDGTFEAESLKAVLIQATKASGGGQLAARLRLAVRGAIMNMRAAGLLRSPKSAQRK